ncbi:hypothetical protein [Rhodoplanes serenus]|uniref:hypothetical protein n=1 Tax=Rhodoplanes serenus TaxID=200615 RepID=UPI000DACA49B|nr:hypothetical protein [Rhodoplanes serenus]RAI28741.1 hypothetical protein CH340_23350 [Rhodoplanes serenus]
MSSTADVLDTARDMAAALVRRAERDTGSRMSAYERVGAAVGVSASWIRKFVAGDPGAKRVSFVAGLAIVNQYRRLCERIEAEAEAERTRANALMRDFDAATSGALDVVALVSTAEASGTDAPERREVS